jgi:hypothetical protein
MTDPWWTSDDFAPDRPGTIALVAGVSDYEHLPESTDDATKDWMMGLPKLNRAALGGGR